ncbi:MAG: hypothetical protein QOH15_3267, partial [Gaiellales bacterium]|nr:hypothetical protein [Gaiellales bacterium]
ALLRFVVTPHVEGSRPLTALTVIVAFGLCVLVLARLLLTAEERGAARRRIRPA